MKLHSITNKSFHILLLIRTAIVKERITKICTDLKITSLDLTSETDLIETKSFGCQLCIVEYCKQNFDSDILRKIKSKHSSVYIILLSHEPINDKDTDINGLVDEMISDISSNILEERIQKLSGFLLKAHIDSDDAPGLQRIKIKLKESEEKIKEIDNERKSERILKDIALNVAKDHQENKEILNHLSNGFFTIDKNLMIGKTTSRACIEIFSGKISGKKIGSSLNLASNFEEQLEVGLIQLFDNLMPMSVNISLLPEIVRTNKGQYIKFDYKPITDKDDNPLKVIVTATDITETVEEKNSLKNEQRQDQLLINLLKNMESFKIFINNLQKDLYILSTTSKVTDLMRTLHTLKGNFGIFGFEDIATRIHTMESSVLKLNSDSVIRQMFKSYSQEIDSLMNDYLIQNYEILKIDFRKTQDFDYRVPGKKLIKFEKFLETHFSESDELAKILEIIKSIRFMEISYYICNFRNIVSKYCETNSKNIKLKVTGEDIKIDPNRYSIVFKNLVHLLMNACDHGIESPELREMAGKKKSGTIQLSFKLEKETGLFLVEMRDDGRGIDSEKLRTMAVQKSIWSEDDAKNKTNEECNLLIFEDGISTTEKVNTVSGRGVGLGALNEAILRADGSLRITSTPGLGTVFTIIFLPESKLSWSV